MSCRWTTRAAVALALNIVASPALADRHEATFSLRPLGALARIDDGGVEDPATVVGAGLAASFSRGIRNWIDVGGELAAMTLQRARYDQASLNVVGEPRTGQLSRTTQLAQLRAAATLRFGVAWVPTVQLTVGIGGRQRGAAQLRVPEGTLLPDGQDSELTLDVLAGVRAGLEHRITRRWTLGISAGVTQAFGVGTPDVQLVDGSVALSYTWYPLW
ncbi:MAG: hypothetical protein ACTHU0_24870 [Kofleriaceae bacterium]